MDTRKLAIEECAKNDQARSAISDEIKEGGPAYLMLFTQYLLRKESLVPFMSTYELLEYKLARQLIREFSVEMLNRENEKESDN